MFNLVEFLRTIDPETVSDWDFLLNMAANRVETLEVENARLREASTTQCASGIEYGLEMASQVLDEARAGMAGETLESDVTAEEVLELLRKTAKTFRSMKIGASRLAQRAMKPPLPSHTPAETGAGGE